MNDKFKSKMKEKGKTAYAVSKETGIPYTTMNELMNDILFIFFYNAPFYSWL